MVLLRDQENKKLTLHGSFFHVQGYLMSILLSWWLYILQNSTAKNQKISRNPNSLIPGFRFDSLYNLDYSPDDKDGKRDEKDHAKPIHRPMERLYE